MYLRGKFVQTKMPNRLSRHVGFQSLLRAGLLVLLFEGKQKYQYLAVNHRLSHQRTDGIIHSILNKKFNIYRQFILVTLYIHTASRICPSRICISNNLPHPRFPATESPQPFHQTIFGLIRAGWDGIGRSPTH